MASPTIYKLSPERRETVDRFGDTSHEVNRGNTDPGPNKGPSKFPPPTHDTSRIGWHMKDLECFAKSIETVGCSYHQDRMLRDARQSALPFQTMAAHDTGR
jgi:hypothetical protein